MLTVALPALEAYSTSPTAVIQQVAAWPVAAVCSGVRVPLSLMRNDATAFGPASVRYSVPVSGSVVKANGTVPGRLVTTGAGAGAPSSSRAKTSTLFPLALVVTTSLLPQSANPT